jgi:hypothetical protein
MLDFGEMDAVKARRLSAIAKEFKPKFLEMVDTMGDQNGQSLNWVLSSLASRDRYLSPLFERCCKLLLAEEALAEGERNFCVSDWHLAKTIRTLCGVHQVKASVKNIAPLRERVREWVKPWVLLLLHSLQLLRRLRARKCPAALEKSVILLDVFVGDNEASGMSVQDKKYQDRYFSGWQDSVSLSEQELFYYFPVISGTRNAGDTIRRVRACGGTFIIPDDYMRVTDYWWVVSKTLGFLMLRLPDIRLAGVSLKPMLKAERYALFSNNSGMVGLFLYRFAKQSAAAGLRVKRLVSSNENQIVDKGLVLGFHRYHPASKVVAYKGWPLSEDCNPHQIPSSRELLQDVHPQEIWIAGEGYKTLVQSHVPNAKVRVGPSLRFGSLRKISPQDEAANSLLVGLTVEHNECEGMLSMLRRAAPLLPGHLRIVIKPHPLLPREHLAERISTDCDEWEWTESKLEGKIAEAKCYFTSASSSAIEALAAGVPVILLGNCRGLSWDIIPKTISRAVWAQCFTSSELASAVLRLSECPLHVKQKVAAQIQQVYFPKQTRGSVRQLFGLAQQGEIVQEG